MDLKRTELAILERALVREHRACFDKRRALRPSVRALMIVETKNLLDKVQAEAKRRDEEQS